MNLKDKIKLGTDIALMVAGVVAGGGVFYPEVQSFPEMPKKPEYVKKLDALYLAQTSLDLLSVYTSEEGRKMHNQIRGEIDKLFVNREEVAQQIEKYRDEKSAVEKKKDQSTKKVFGMMGAGMVLWTIGGMRIFTRAFRRNDEEGR